LAAVFCPKNLAIARQKSIDLFDSGSLRRRLVRPRLCA